MIIVHIEDGKAQPPDTVRDNERLVPGEGAIDLAGSCRRITADRYEGHVSPEPLGWFPVGAPADEVAALTLRATVGVLARAGIKPRAAGSGDESAGRVPA